MVARPSRWPALVAAIAARSTARSLAAVWWRRDPRPGLAALVGWTRRTWPPRAARASGRERLPAGVALVLDGWRRRPTGSWPRWPPAGHRRREPYLTRYLPALVLAGVLPVLAIVAMATQDPLSAAIVLATLPLVPVFARPGRAGDPGPCRAAVAGASPPVRPLRRRDARPADAGAFRRAPAQTDDPQRHRPLPPGHPGHAAAGVRLLGGAGAGGDPLRRAGGRPVGLRLAPGARPRTALVVLLLAPEAYWPLRRVGAEFHAAAEGAATFAEVNAVLAQPLPASGDAPVPDLTGSPSGSATCRSPIRAAAPPQCRASRPRSSRVSWSRLPDRQAPASPR